MIGLEPGTLFAGRYEIIRSLGAGGMGAVYLACDPSDRDFQVAIKLLYPGSIQSNQARERFRNEIVASYRINHPNIVRAYEYFDAEDVQAYAMEYVDGGDLMEQMRNGPMSAEEVVRIIKNVAAALAASHKVGIIHRDLKPENILISKKGEIKLTDFGVARLRGSSTLTQAGAMVGTPKYIAPEYAETGECDERGDIFAAGVIAYEMIAGQSPFGDEHTANPMRDRFAKPIPALDKITSCPPKLARIIEKAMEMQVAKRFQSANDLYKALDSYENADDDSVPVPVKDEEASSDLVLETVKAWDDTESKDAEEPNDEDSMSEDWREEFASSREEVAPTILGDASEQTGPNVQAKPLVIAASLFFLICLVGFVKIAFFHGDTVAALPDGVYQGKVLGLTDDYDRPIYTAAWVRDGNGWILLGVEGCPVVSADSKVTTFECKDKKFEFKVEDVVDSTLKGTLESPDKVWRVEIAPAKVVKGITGQDEATLIRTKQKELEGLKRQEETFKEKLLANAIAVSNARPVAAPSNKEEIEAALLLLGEKERELQELERAK